MSIGRRFYKDDPYFLNGVPCLENGKEGVLTDYQCLAVCPILNAHEVLADLQGELHVQKRGYWGYYYQGENGLIDGAPCWQDGRQGVVGGLLCIVVSFSSPAPGILLIYKPTSMLARGDCSVLPTETLATSLVNGEPSEMVNVNLYDTSHQQRILCLQVARPRCRCPRQARYPRFRPR